VFSPLFHIDQTQISRLNMVILIQMNVPRFQMAVGQSKAVKKSKIYGVEGQEIGIAGIRDGTNQSGSGSGSRGVSRESSFTRVKRRLPVPWLGRSRLGWPMYCISIYWLEVSVSGGRTPKNSCCAMENSNFWLVYFNRWGSTSEFGRSPSYLRFGGFLSLPRLAAASYAIANIVTGWTKNFNTIRNQDWLKWWLRNCRWFNADQACIWFKCDSEKFHRTDS
jgi:hypothetical protein